MKAGETIFQRLLDGKLQYRVPMFQRTYSWDEDQWERLWDDILELYAMANPRTHFIGSIVTQPIDPAPEHAAKFMLIDGQQRLTTILILLAAIRSHNRLTTEDPSLSDEIRDTCLTNLHVANEAEKFKMLPTQRDREAFQQAMDGMAPSIGSQIGKAWAYFSKMMESKDREGNPISLRRLKERITFYLDLVSIRLESGDSPNRIFESLNNTGVRLKASDLIRNYIFMRIPGEEKQEHAYTHTWLPMQEDLGDNIDDFFWRYSMKDGSLTRWDDIFDDTKESLDTKTDGEMVQILQDFSKFSGFYMSIKKPNERESNRDIANQLTRLNDWEADVCYPFLLTLFDMQSRAHVRGDDIVSIIRMIESFVVRRSICGVPTNRLRSLFAGMVTQCNHNDVVGSCQSYLLGNQWPEDEEFFEKLVSYRAYNPARLARTRLILRSIENSFGDLEAPELTPDITIEHIMPQSLTKDWKDELGDNWNDVHSRWLDSIGNLTLTGYNPALSNRSFQRKKEIFEGRFEEQKEVFEGTERTFPGTNFQLTKDTECGVLRFDKWNEDSIQKRAGLLSRRAVSIWGR